MNDYDNYSEYELEKQCFATQRESVSDFSEPIGQNVQRNNLKVKYNKMSCKWQVITPDKRVLEEFTTRNAAINFANDTYDFLSPENRARALEGDAESWGEDYWFENRNSYR